MWKAKLLVFKSLFFPWATSSLRGWEAAFTRALVAAAMDLVVASSICSSKFKDSSASCKKRQKWQRESAGKGRLKVQTL